MPPASPPHQNGQQPRQSTAASFFAAVNQGHAYERRPTRSFSAGADDIQTSQASSNTAIPPDEAPDVGNAVSGSHLGRSQSMKNPTRVDPPPPLSFSAAGADLQSTPMIASNYTPPAAARHPLFSHHAVPPSQQSAQPRGFSPALSYMSDPGPVPPITIDPSCPSPPSPGSTVSSAFSPATAFLQAFSSRSSATEVAPDAQGARVLDYTLGKILGRGGFSTVRQATHIKTGEIFACKIVKRDDLSDESGSAERFEDEIRIWQTLPAHERLLPLFEMMRTEYATFMIMPCLEGSLLDILRIEGGSESTARKWFPGVVAAVAVLHEGFEGFEGNMMHGDLKLDNFLVDNHGGVCLGDFGMTHKVMPTTSKKRGPSPANHRPSHLPAHLQVHGRLSSAPDSPRMPSRSPHRRRDTLATTDVNQPGHQPCPSASLPYASPELLGATPSGPSLAQDIWALGIILHALLTGRLPFNDSFDPRLQMKILRGQWEEPYVGHEWLEVLHGTLHRDFRRRWDIRRVRECDAVTGWREVRTKSRSRSRARVPDGGRGRRTPGDSPVHPHHPDGISNPGRGRDRSRSRASHGAPQQYRRDSHPSPAPHDERERGRFLHPANPQAADGSRSRSQSATRRTTPGHSRPGSLHALEVSRMSMSTRNSADGLAGELDGMAITRGRSTQRSGAATGLPNRRSPSSSASSLHVADLPEENRIASRSPSAARPPRPLSGAEQKRGRSRARGEASVPGSAGWWEAAFGTGRQEKHHDSAPSSGAHTPPHKRGSPHAAVAHSYGHGLAHGHVHGHGHGHHPGGADPFALAHQASHSASSSRPPTLGFELDVVDENAPASRGRAAATVGRDASRSKSRGRRDHRL